MTPTSVSCGMLSPRLRRTLRYCLVLFVVLTPVYYLVYTLLWDEVPRREALLTSLMYAVINMVFLGALHFVYSGGSNEER